MTSLLFFSMTILLISLLVTVVLMSVIEIKLNKSKICDLEDKLYEVKKNTYYSEDRIREDVRELKYDNKVIKNNINNLKHPDGEIKSELYESGDKIIQEVYYYRYNEKFEKSYLIERNEDFIDRECFYSIKKIDDKIYIEKDNLDEIKIIKKYDDEKDELISVEILSVDK